MVFGFWKPPVVSAGMGWERKGAGNGQDNKRDGEKATSVKDMNRKMIFPVCMKGRVFIGPLVHDFSNLLILNGNCEIS